MLLIFRNFSKKRRLSFFLACKISVVVFLLLPFAATAQIREYLPLFRTVDSCLIFKIDAKMQLYHIVFRKDAPYKNNKFCGWLQKETTDYYQFISITGSESRFKKEVVDKIVQCTSDTEIMGIKRRSWGVVK